ncbi:MAG: hypothetical protein K9J13_06250 [Saprospiraceae bacterium]|nr:hypothetical protein [Saprospiraceae bacterium]
MKTRILLCLCFFCMVETSFAQLTEFKIGYKSLKDPTVSGYAFFSESHKVGVTFSYIFPLTEERYYGNGLISGPGYILTRSFNQQGFGISIQNKFRSRKNDRKWHSVTFEYQSLFSGNYIDDLGFFWGSTELRYSEFKDKYDNFAIIYGKHLTFTENDIIDLFFEIGIRYKRIHRQYSVIGTYSNKIPTNISEDLIAFSPVLRIGFEIRIFGKNNKE